MKHNPALTPEEWQTALSRPPGVILSGEGTADRHSIAAICLHGQPYGFTHEDVKMLRLIAGARGVIKLDWQERVNSLADRIEVLLPPA